MPIKRNDWIFLFRKKLKLSLIFFPEFEIDLSIMFKDLTNLIELEVEISEIKTIHPSAFESLINLKLLVLSSNLISSVDENLFKECVNLDSLLLDYNKLNNILFICRL